MSLRAPGRYETDLTKFQAAIEQISQGRLNCTGTFTLTPGVASTVVPAPNVAPGTVILFSAQTANAAGVLATTFVLQSNVFQGSFTVSHAIAGSSDRTFGFAGLG